MARKGFAELMLEAGTRFVSRTAEVVMSDPRGKEAMALAVGLAQQGKRRLEQAQERVLKAAGIPGRQDYEELTRQLARIKRKARELAAAMEANGGAPSYDDGAEDALDDRRRDEDEGGPGNEPPRR